MRELFTTWTDYQHGIDLVLAAATVSLSIYDPDLEHMKLESEGRLEQLRRLLQQGRPDCLRIAVRDAHRLQSEHPRLMELLTRYGHLMSIVETGETISHLRDSLLIGDDCHCLVRFDQDQARCKLLQSERDETAPYLQRFNDIWLENNTPISPRPLGL